MWIQGDAVGPGVGATQLRIANMQELQAGGAEAELLTSVGTQDCSNEDGSMFPVREYCTMPAGWHYSIDSGIDTVSCRSYVQAGPHLRQWRWQRPGRTLRQPPPLRLLGPERAHWRGLGLVPWPDLGYAQGHSEHSRCATQGCFTSLTLQAVRYGDTYGLTTFMQALLYSQQCGAVHKSPWQDSCLGQCKQARVCYCPCAGASLPLFGPGRAGWPRRKARCTPAAGAGAGTGASVRPAAGGPLAAGEGEPGDGEAEVGRVILLAAGEAGDGLVEGLGELEGDVLAAGEGEVEAAGDGDVEDAGEGEAAAAEPLSSPGNALPRLSACWPA